MKPAQILVAKLSNGRGELMVPLMIIRDGDELYFKAKTGVKRDGRGVITNKQGFLKKLEASEPKVVRAVQDLGEAVVLQILPARVWVYLGRKED